MVLQQVFLGEQRQLMELSNSDYWNEPNFLFTYLKNQLAEVVKFDKAYKKILEIIKKERDISLLLGEFILLKKIS